MIRQFPISARTAARGCWHGVGAVALLVLLAGCSDTASNGGDAQTTTASAPTTIAPTTSAAEPTTAQTPTTAAAAAAAETALTTAALSVTAMNPPYQVLGSDGQVHIDYDLVITNAYGAPATLTKVEVLDSDGRTLLSLDGDALLAATAAFFGAPTVEIPASGVVATIIDVVVPSTDVPTRLNHRIAYQLPADFPYNPIIGGQEVTGPELDVDPRQAPVLRAPVSGAGWVNANSCCAVEAAHRGGRIAVGAAGYRKFEMFGIDWQPMREGRFFEGDGAQNEQYFGYGVDVLAVADATVVSTRDGLRDQPPRLAVAPVVPPDLLAPDDFVGNTVVLQLDDNTWAGYAHLQPGSITVQPGDRVTAGQVLGKLGSSGNSSAPHLHFQLSDGPELFTSNSVPFVIDRYTAVGTVDPSVVPQAFDSLTPEPLAITGPSREETATYPLTYVVTDFG